LKVRRILKKVRAELGWYSKEKNTKTELEKALTVSSILGEPLGLELGTTRVERRVPQRVLQYSGIGKPQGCGGTCGA